LRIASPAIRRLLVEQAGGDALDSVIAAWIAWRTASSGVLGKRRTPLERLEGRIYSGM
jgi:hypothetical protein